MKVLYVFQLPDYSGAELLNVPVMTGDPDALLACPPDSRVEALARRLGVETVGLAHRSMRHSGGRLELARSLARGLRSARDLRAVLRARPERDVVLAVSLRAGLLAALAALGLRRRVVWSLTDFLPPKRALRWAIRTVAFLGMDRAIAISHGIADDFAGAGPLARRVHVIYPGAKLDRFDPAAAVPGRPRAIVLGQVSPTKQTDVAVEVARIAGAEVDDLVVDIVGRAQFREEDFAFERELHARVAADARLSRQVTFSGYADDVAGRLAGAGLLLHCRVDEPLGLAIIEAMAAGLPVVAPAAAGPTEIVEDGRTGLLYPPGDAAAAAAHVLRLVRDPVAAAAFGAAGRARAEAMFSTVAQVTATRGALEALGARTTPA